jgi:transposase InsO family protein
MAAELIEPGKPNQNAYIESFNGRLRDEILPLYLFSQASSSHSAFDNVFGVRELRLVSRYSLASAEKISAIAWRSAFFFAAGSIPSASSLRRADTAQATAIQLATGHRFS